MDEFHCLILLVDEKKLHDYCLYVFIQMFSMW